MKRTRQNVSHHAKLTAIALAVLTCLVPAGWSGWRTASVTRAWIGKSQTSKTVNINAQRRTDAVIITKVTVGGQQIQPGVSTSGVRETQPGTPFQADEDWLKNMTIFLKNRTDKAIVRAEVELFFPDTGDGSTSRPVAVYGITIGQRPEINNILTGGRKLQPHPEASPLLFAPGQTISIPIADYIAGIESSVVEKMPLSQIASVVIHRSEFYFADGMRWDDTGFAIPDPNRPGEYKDLGPRYFPGKRSENWPPE